MCLLIIKLFQFTTYGQILIKFYNFPLLFLTGNSNWWKDSFLLTNYYFPLRLLDITTTTFSNPYLTSNLGLILITASKVFPSYSLYKYFSTESFSSGSLSKQVTSEVGSGDFYHFISNNTNHRPSWCSGLYQLGYLI